MKIKKAYQFSLLLLVWILVPSCVKDKLSNCLPAETAVNLKFHLAVNSEDGNDINLNDVTYLDVYLFDKETGTFYKHFRDEDPQLQDKTYRLKIIAAPNTYDIIVWGNTNNNDYSYLPLLPFVENQTTLSEAELWLQGQANTRNEEQLELSHTIEHLFYAQHLDCSIAPSDTVLEIPAVIVQNTYTFEVYITHRPVDNKPLSVAIEGDHNGYDFYNDKLVSLDINYKKEAEPSGSNLKQQKAILRTLRIEPDSPVRFKVYSWEGEEILNESLLDLLNQASANGGFRLNLDKKHNFRITVNFGETEADVSISVDGWNAYEEDSNLIPQS